MSATDPVDRDALIEVIDRAVENASSGLFGEVADAVIAHLGLTVAEPIVIGQWRKRKGELYYRLDPAHATGPTGYPWNCVTGDRFPRADHEMRTRPVVPPAEVIKRLGLGPAVGR